MGEKIMMLSAGDLDEALTTAGGFGSKDVVFCSDGHEYPFGSTSATQTPTTRRHHRMRLVAAEIEAA